MQATGSVNLIFFQEDENGVRTTLRVKLADVSVVENLSFNLFSADAVFLRQQNIRGKRGVCLQNALRMLLTLSSNASLV